MIRVHLECCDNRSTLHHYEPEQQCYCAGRQFLNLVIQSLRKVKFCPREAGALCLDKFAESSNCLAVGAANEYKCLASVLRWDFDRRGHRGLLKTIAAVHQAASPGLINSLINSALH